MRRYAALLMIFFATLRRKTQVLNMDDDEALRIFNTIKFALIQDEQMMIPVTKEELIEAIDVATMAIIMKGMNENV